ncbi:hypothetical protein [Thiomonas intermedia]|nr:hypothetical protein [Thiomonas intermedia]
MIAGWTRRIAFVLAVGLAPGGCAVQTPPMSGPSGVHLYGQIDEGVQFHP